MRAISGNASVRRRPRSSHADPPRLAAASPVPSRCAINLIMRAFEHIDLDCGAALQSHAPIPSVPTLDPLRPPTAPSRVV